MKSFTSKSSQCLHKIVRLARHQKCNQKAMICAQNCQFKQAHLLKGDHPIILVSQFIVLIKDKRAQIQREGLKHISIIQKQYEQMISFLKKKKQESVKNIEELIKTSSYPQKYLSGLQKVQNQRYQSLLCKQVYDLLKYQPMLTKKTVQAFQRNVREFQNCKVKNIKNDRIFNAEYEQKNSSDLTNKKNLKQQKMMQKQKQKYQIIRQNPKVTAPAYLLLEDKLYFQELISKNQQLQIQLRKAQNSLRQLNKNNKQNYNYNYKQTANNNSQSDQVVQIKGNQSYAQHNNYVMRAIQKYIQKKGQQNINNNKQKSKQFQKPQNSTTQNNNKIPPKFNISPIKPNKQLPKQKQNKQILREETKKIQIQQKNTSKTVESNVSQKQVIFKNINEKINQKQQKKDERLAYTLQGLAKKKVDQNIARKDQKKMINQVNNAGNPKQIIKQEYNESQEIYKYYDKEEKNNQNIYTKTEQLKKAGNSIQNIIKLQLTYPIPSYTHKFSFKQIPKLDYSKQKITKLNYASKVVNKNQQSSTPNKLNIQNQKEKTPNNNVKNVNNNNKNNLNQGTSSALDNQLKNQNKVTSFLNTPTGTFKPPPSMLLNDPTIKAPKVDVFKVFQMQQQMKKVKQQKKLQEQNIRKQVQEKQKLLLQQQKRKKQIQQKKRLQEQKQKQKINEQLIQSLMRSSDNTPNGQAQDHQIPKLKFIQPESNKQNEKPLNQNKNQEMKVQQQRQQNSMDIQEQNSDSFQI